MHSGCVVNFKMNVRHCDNMKEYGVGYHNVRT